MSLNSVYQPTVLELAQSGNLKAIGYWLNSFLVPQGIHVRVGKSRTPQGKNRSRCLHLLVEFERLPDRDRLVRFICHRLYQLRCGAFQTVRIVAQRQGANRIAWRRSVRLLERQKATTRRLRKLERRSPAQSGSTGVVNLVPYRSRHPQTTTRLKRQRALALGGSAAAALMFGYGFQMMTQRLIAGNARQSAPAAPPRPTTVMTATEPIAVAQQPVHNAKDPTVTLAFSGDAALGRAPLGQPLSWDLTQLEDYRRADVTLTNLENPLASTTQVAQAEGTDTKPLEVLQAGSIDVVNLASSRLLNEGAGELEQTISALQRAGIHTVGAGRDQQEARRPEILDVKGQRIAYLSYSDAIASAASSRRAGVNPALIEQVEADIRAIRNQVDWVIVNYHWSRALAEYPGNRQMNLARFAVDQGADLVIGHHPKVLQGAEIYKGRAIAYSLGNFIFTSGSSGSQLMQGDYDTAVLKVSLREAAGDSGPERQMRLEFLPVQVRQAKPEIVTGEKAEQVLQYLQQASGGFEQPLQSPMILDAQPIAPPAPPATPTAPFQSPSDSFIAPPDAAPSRPDSFIAPPDAAPPKTTERSGSFSPDDATAPTTEEVLDQTDSPDPNQHLNAEELTALSNPPLTPSAPDAVSLQPSEAIDALIESATAADPALAEAQAQAVAVEAEPAASIAAAEPAFSPDPKPPKPIAAAQQPSSEGPAMVPAPAAVLSPEPLTLDAESAAGGMEPAD